MRNWKAWRKVAASAKDRAEDQHPVKPVLCPRFLSFSPAARMNITD
jgi:hypothetical protein